MALGVLSDCLWCPPREFLEQRESYLSWLNLLALQNPSLRGPRNVPVQQESREHSLQDLDVTFLLTSCLPLPGQRCSLFRARPFRGPQEHCRLGWELTRRLLSCAFPSRSFLRRPFAQGEFSDSTFLSASPAAVLSTSGVGRLCLSAGPGGAERFSADPPRSLVLSDHSFRDPMAVCSPFLGL